MVISRFKQLKEAKEDREQRTLTYEVLTAETGLAPATLSSLLGLRPIKRIEAGTIETVCNYFQCGICDFLERIPDNENAGATSPR